MHHLLDVLVSWGPVGLLILATIESAGIPNPGGTDWLLLLLTAARPEDALLCAIAAIVGTTLGSMFFFEVAHRGGERYLARYTSSGRGARFRGWFLRYGLLAVFIPALLPIPLPFKALAACAGAMRVSRVRFFLVLVVARIPRYGGLAYLGAKMGEHSGAWLKEHGWDMAALAAALFFSLYLVIRSLDRPGTGIADEAIPEPSPKP